MALYDYQCNICNLIWNEILHIEDRNGPTEKPCPSCGGKVSRYYTTGGGGFVSPGILQADKNIEKCGALDRLNQIKREHKDMVWSG